MLSLPRYNPVLPVLTYFFLIALCIKPGISCYHTGSKREHRKEMESKSLRDGFVAEGFASAAQVHPKGTNSSVPNTQHHISGGAASRGD